MIRALLLIFEPIATWDRIFRSRRSLGFVLAAYLVPTVLLTCLVEGHGLYKWGQPREIGPSKLYNRGEVVLFETASFILWLGVVFLGARLVKSIGGTFHGRHTMTQTFTTVAYGLGPLFLLHLLDGLKNGNPWIPFAIGIVLSIAVLYQGVPRIMEPDPSHAFGLYLMSSLLLLLISGLARLITIFYLQGKFSAVESFVANLAARLPF